MAPVPVTVGELLDRHAGVLLDAFGVLNDAHHALPGAAALIAELERRGTPYLIVTNDASRSPATCEARFARLGLPIAAHRVITSGSLVPIHYRARGLAGARSFVLGTDDSRAYVIEGGGVLVPLERGVEIDALVVCDDDGFPFLEGIELALSAAMRALDAGRPCALVLPNPDLVYPKTGGELGITAGAIALVVETTLARRHPTARFAHLGKPAPDLFLEGARRLGLPPDRIVMIGDQLETDIAGAYAAGMPSALVAGVSRWTADSAIAPSYLLATIEP